MYHTCLFNCTDDVIGYFCSLCSVHYIRVDDYSQNFSAFSLVLHHAKFWVIVNFAAQTTVPYKWQRRTTDDVSLFVWWHVRDVITAARLRNRQLSEPIIQKCITWNDKTLWLPTVLSRYIHRHSLLETSQPVGSNDTCLLYTSRCV